MLSEYQRLCYKLGKGFVQRFYSKKRLDKLDITLRKAYMEITSEAYLSTKWITIFMYMAVCALIAVLIWGLSTYMGSTLWDTISIVIRNPGAISRFEVEKIDPVNMIIGIMVLMFALMPIFLYVFYTTIQVARSDPGRRI